MLVKSMYGPEAAAYIAQLPYVTLTCGELGGFRRVKFCSTLFHTSNEDLRMAVHGDDFVCLSDDDGFKHIDESRYAVKDRETLGFEASDVKKPSVDEPCAWSWDRSDWTIHGHST